MTTMTLEQAVARASEHHRVVAYDPVVQKESGVFIDREAWAVIYAHLAQRAQAVDVGAKFRAEVERGLAELRPPEHMTTLRAEYWRAGARAAIRAVNTALRNAGVKV